MLLSVTAIDRNSTTGKNSFWRLFPRRNYMLRNVIRFPYTVLSLGNGGKIIFKVRSNEKTFYFILFPLLMQNKNKKLFSDFHRLDYCGIALLIMGSFVPWLYYGFYCHYEHKLIYLSVVVVLGIVSIVVSLWDKFSEPNLRPLRAGKRNASCGGVLINGNFTQISIFHFFRSIHEFWSFWRNSCYPLRTHGGMV